MQIFPRPQFLKLKLSLQPGPCWLFVVLLAAVLLPLWDAAALHLQANVCLSFVLCLSSSALLDCPAAVVDELLVGAVALPQQVVLVPPLQEFFVLVFLSD
jgi:hypothetical protein